MEHERFTVVLLRPKVDGSDIDPDVDIYVGFVHATDAHHAVGVARDEAWNRDHEDDLYDECPNLEDYKVLIVFRKFCNTALYGWQVDV